MGAPTTKTVRKYQTAATTLYQRIHISFPNSSFVRNVIWKWVRRNRRKWFWSTKYWRRKRYQTATLYWSRQGKNQRAPSRACLSSSHPLQKLKVVLMWSCFTELVRQFPVIWNPPIKNISLAIIWLSII